MNNQSHALPVRDICPITSHYAVTAYLIAVLQYMLLKITDRYSINATPQLFVDPSWPP